NFMVDIFIPEDNLFVQGDRDAINRILSNVISNALRYGKDGKYIGFTLRESENHVYIDVIDKGKGIEKEFALSVFERLYTMEDSRNRKIQGNGLGLTIAKNLANQLEGDIFLESEPNVKTIFTVKLKKYKC
ncbi:ATP-binding protein, partial [bacterium 1XD42-8]